MAPRLTHHGQYTVYPSSKHQYPGIAATRNTRSFDTVTPLHRPGTVHVPYRTGEVPIHRKHRHWMEKTDPFAQTPLEVAATDKRRGVVPSKGSNDPAHRPHRAAPRPHTVQEHHHPRTRVPRTSHSQRRPVTVPVNEAPRAQSPPRPIGTPLHFRRRRLCRNNRPQPVPLTLCNPTPNPQAP